MHGKHDIDTLQVSIHPSILYATPLEQALHWQAQYSLPLTPAVSVHDYVLKNYFVTSKGYSFLVAEAVLYLPFKQLEPALPQAHCVQTTREETYVEVWWECV